MRQDLRQGAVAVAGRSVAGACAVFEGAARRPRSGTTLRRSACGNMQPQLGCLATYLVLLWVGQAMRLPPDNPSLAVVDDGYVEGVDLVQVLEQLEGATFDFDVKRN